MTGADARIWPALRVRPRLYYGWVVLGVAALAMVGTLPGRTQGLGLITEPLLRDFGIGRIAFAQINLVATLVGRALLLRHRTADRSPRQPPGADRHRRCARRRRDCHEPASSVMALLVFVTLTRGFGQSALSIVSLAMVGKWFRRRLTWAMAIYALVMSVGFMAAFPPVARSCSRAAGGSRGPRLASCLLVGLAPLAWVLDRSTPEDVRPGDTTAAELRLDDEPPRLSPQHRPRSPTRFGRPPSGCSRWRARSTAWSRRALACSTSRSLPSADSRPTSITPRWPSPPSPASPATSRRARSPIAARCATCWCAALVMLAGRWRRCHTSRRSAHVMAQAVAMGIAGGFVMVVFFSFWGRAYGRAHLGRIQGAAQAMTVVASAVGPLFLAWYVDATGSYAAAFYMLAGIVVALAAAAAIVRIPAGAGARLVPGP